MRSGAHNEISDLNGSLWVHFCSLLRNSLRAEGGKAIAEALKVNTSITVVEEARMPLVYVSL